MDSIIVSMQGINKSFETETVITTALVDFELTINTGEFVSVSGPSGCGKSTLLSIMGLLDSPTSGQYIFSGKDVSKLSKNEAAEIRCMELGFVFQSFNLIDEMSVADNVALPLHYRPNLVPKKEVEEKVAAYLDVVGLSHRALHKPSELSGGQQQRVAIARALVSEPNLILVDEPTGNLDSTSGDKIMDLFVKLNAQGKTLCMVTHDPRYANVASRQLKLRDGKIATME